MLKAILILVGRLSENS